MIVLISIIILAIVSIYGYFDVMNQIKNMVEKLDM
jgi:hypothetical protein